MGSVTKYPTSISQASSSGSNHYKQWSNLGNLKTSGGYAQCGPSGDPFAGMNGTYRRPSALTLSGYDFSTVSSDKEVSSVVVEFYHREYPTGGAYPNIKKPVITLYNGSTKLGSKSGSEPVHSLDTGSVTFTGVSRSQLSNLRVKFEYPSNSNTNLGYVILYYVRVKVNYSESKYSVSATLDSSDDVYIDDNFNATFTINNTNNTSYNPNATITLPDGVSFTGQYTGTGTITGNGNVLTWKTGLGKNIHQSQVTLKLKSETTGTHNIIVNETITPSSKTLQVPVVNRPLTVTITGPTSSSIKSDETVNATVNVVSEENFTNLESIDFYINGEVTSTSISFKEDNVTKPLTRTEYTDDEGIVWNKYSYVPDVSTELTHTLTVTIPPNSLTGTINLKIEYLDEIRENYSVKVYPSSIPTPPYTGFTLTSEELARMKDEQIYRFSCNLFIEEPSLTDEVPHSEVPDYGVNQRIGLFNGEVPVGADPYEYAYENLTIITDCPELTNEWFVGNVDFTYDSDYDVIVLVLGDPVSSYDFLFTNPCISELEDNNVYEEFGNYPTPLGNLVSGESCTVTGSCNRFVLTDFNEFTNISTGDETVITGLEVGFDYPNKSDINLLLTVKIGGVTGSRSLVLVSDDEEHITLGGEFDRWNIRFNNFVDMNNLEIIIQEYSSEDTIFEINDVNVKLYYNNIEDSKYTCLIDGEDTRYYGLFLQNVTIPFGLQTETQYYNVDGTDTNEAYRQNITGKEISISFSVDGCTLNDTTRTLEQITKLFSNERDELNRPLLKTVEFNHYPNKCFEYLLEKGVENSININDYECNITLTVPSGTSKSLDEKITYITGSNDGLVRVNPILKIKDLSSVFSVKELKSNQILTIREADTEYTFGANDYCEIDCLNRKVTLYQYDNNNEEYTAHDITSGVDYSSQWFSINGAYNFTGVDCTIEQVMYYERW